MSECAETNRTRRSTTPTETMQVGKIPEATPRRVLAGWMIDLTRPVLAPLGVSIVVRIIDQLLAIFLLVLGVWGVVTVFEGDHTVIGPVVGSMIATALVKAFLRYIEQFSGHYVAFRALEIIRRYFFSQLWPQAPAAVSRLKSGDVFTRTTRDIDRLEVFFAHTIAPAISAIVVPTIALVLLGTTIDPVLALAIVPFLLPVVLVIPFLGIRAARIQTTKVATYRANMAQLAADDIQGIAEILGYDRVEERMTLVDHEEVKIRNESRTLVLIASIQQGLILGVLLVGLVVVTLIGLDRFHLGLVDLQGVTIALAVMLGCFDVSRGVESFIMDLDRSFASAQRVRDLAKTPPAVTSPLNPRTLPPSQLSVSFQDVSFTYPSRDNEESLTATLEHISFDIVPGSHTCVVGRSGSGKSTLAQLLMRYWDVDNGAICVGAIDIRDVDVEELRTTVSLVTQDSHLFNVSIRENLRLACSDATDEEIEEVCTVTALDEEIRSFPAGYDTVVKEMGERLSGGQQQRLSLARALLRQPQVLILDEFTSHLDAKTEHRVRKALRERLPEVTILEIAHHVRNTEGVSQIIVLDRGKIVAQEKEAGFRSLIAGGFLSKATF